MSFNKLDSKMSQDFMNKISQTIPEMMDLYLSSCQKLDEDNSIFF